MSALSRKPSANEDNFIHQNDIAFQSQARSNRLIGLWAAATMGLDNADAYAEEIVSASIAAPDGAFKRLRDDFDAAGIAVLDNEIRSRMVGMLRDVAKEMRSI